jgi:GalNAc-alpha-(1->4)-GalNAc-alpha-(1->3)-diNAcBac-PP-undecaprenol alpha-1,4-N-acetyl-D-galactosaminyltransferase
MPKRKIAFLISSLEGGGAERIVSDLASNWAKKGFDVVILTLAGTEVARAYPLHSNVKVQCLGIAGRTKGLWDAVRSNATRISRLRKALRSLKPDFLLSLTEAVNVLTIISSRRLGFPVFCCDVVDPQYYSYGKIWRFLRDITYPMADAIIVQTEEVRGKYPFWLKSKIQVIPNPVDLANFETPEKIKKTRFQISGMGRLTSQKGFDVLLTAFAGIANDIENVDLKIYGSGPELRSLEALREQFGLQDRVTFPGFVDAAKAMDDTDLFVLSSRYEGLPNVLLEAMAAGLPCISTSCPCGPKEIISDGHNGLLVPVDDPAMLGAAMKRLIEDEALRMNIGRQAKKDMDRFDISAVSHLWENLFNEQGKTTK